MIDMARRATATPPWLTPHTSRLSTADRAALLVEAKATLAQVHSFLRVPYLAQTESYFRPAPGIQTAQKQHGGLLDPDAQPSAASTRVPEATTPQVSASVRRAAP